MSQDSLEKDPQTPVWVKRSVHAFLNNEIEKALPLTGENLTGTFYECGNTRVVLPIIEGARLGVYYRIPRNRDSHTEENKDQLYFRYELPDMRVPALAEIVCTVADENHFLILHRLVDKQYRQIEIGSRLLKEAEHWFQSLANAEKKEVSLTIPAAQVGVFGWALRNGYEVESWDQALLDRILEHPEEFEIADVERDDGLTGEGYVFPKGESEKTIKTAVRLQFKKILTPKAN